jgi:hypothetical protein
LAEEGRQKTKDNILKHHETFCFPSRPTVSRRCQHLMLSLITDKEYRLCSERYRMKDLVTSSSSSSSGASSKMRDFAGRYVFSYDAEDIKAHKWFRNIPWERLHELEPPLVPKLRSIDDTHYFDNGGSVSDRSESESEDEGQVQGANDGAAEGVPELLFPSPPCSIAGTGWSPTVFSVAGHSPAAHLHAHPHHNHGECFQNYYNPASTATNEHYSIPPPLPSLESPISAYPPAGFGFPFTPPPHMTPMGMSPITPTQEHLAFLAPLRYPLQTLALTVLATPPPHDDPHSKLHTLELYLEQLQPGATDAERERLREFARRFFFGEGGDGNGEEARRRRPRDRLLRDKGTRGVAMEVRRRMAFLGYEWTRMGRNCHRRREGAGGGEGVGVGVGLDGEGGDDGGDEENEEAGWEDEEHGVWVPRGERGAGAPRPGFQGWGGDVAVVRAMYSGPWSLR